MEKELRQVFELSEVFSIDYATYAQSIWQEKRVHHEAGLHAYIGHSRPKGSTESIRGDMIGGFNTFLKEEKGQHGTAIPRLEQVYSQDPYEVSIASSGSEMSQNSCGKPAHQHRCQTLQDAVALFEKSVKGTADMGGRFLPARPTFGPRESRRSVLIRKTEKIPGILRRRNDKMEQNKD